LHRFTISLIATSSAAVGAAPVEYVTSLPASARASRSLSLSSSFFRPSTSANFWPSHSSAGSTAFPSWYAIRRPSTFTSLPLPVVR
jgi:hypothetical protein